MPDNQIAKALKIAGRYSQNDSAQHKSWVIDQMVRALTDCPETTSGVLGESLEYTEFVADCKAGDDVPETYSWDEGTPP